MLTYKTSIDKNDSIITNLQNGELKISSYNAKLKNIQETVKTYSKDKGSLVDKLFELRKEEQTNE